MGAGWLIPGTPESAAVSWFPQFYSSVWSLRPLDAGLAFTIYYIARDERIASPAVDGAFRSPS